MCEICRKTPCDPRCPNAEEPKQDRTCTQCGREIPGNEWYYELSEGPICYECIDEMSAADILEIMGVGMKLG